MVTVTTTCCRAMTHSSTFCQLSDQGYGAPVAPPETLPDELPNAPLTMLQPIVDALGATLLPTDEATDDDLEVVWGGAVLAAVRRPDPHLDLHDALPTLIAEVEHDIGLPCAEMDRSQKQETVALLNERGAFTLRKSVEDVAEALGVSRFTVYNYLERSETD